MPPGDALLARKIGDATREAGLAVSSYGSYYATGEGDDFAPVLETAIALGAPMVRVWAGRRPSAESDRRHRECVVEDARRIAALARAEGVRVAFELHGGTLTDTLSSTLALLEAIGDKLFGTYWQPYHETLVEKNLDALQALGPWLANVHVFHWDPVVERHPLAEGVTRWQRFLQTAAQFPGERYALLEFVRGDCMEQFMEDARTLKWLVQGHPGE